MNAYYSSDLEEFMHTDSAEVIGQLAKVHVQDLKYQQTAAWLGQIEYLKNNLPQGLKGKLYFEFKIPRMGKRADCILFLSKCILVIEFKVGSSSFDAHAVDQVYDYSLDLKNFHLGSHNLPIVPILIATQAVTSVTHVMTFSEDLVCEPIEVGSDGFEHCVNFIVNEIALKFVSTGNEIETNTFSSSAWESSGYMPTPTIVEAAKCLYQSHDVTEISRSGAGAKNLAATSQEVAEIIEASKLRGKKSICFVTGVPGAGKTLAGLNIATSRALFSEEDHAVFLSGNGPLVDVLREALTRDQSEREGITKNEAQRKVRSFIQNIHHFRDEYFENQMPPVEKVVVFDEAQRAWSQNQATKFMKQKWGDGYTPQSEPEFLIRVMDRHQDWCCIICLIGGGQEINTGEAGIIEWLSALKNTFNDWDVYTSDLLQDRHYTIDDNAREELKSSKYKSSSNLHLATSMRSFRAEKLSSFVSHVINGENDAASSIYQEIHDQYPIVISRDLKASKEWLRAQARGTERVGLVASAGGLRLRPEGIFVKASIDPANWFLNDKKDVRSSYYLEDVATQFDVQGLELDWVGVCWDGDLRFQNGTWVPFSFKGTKWQTIASVERKNYQLNAYRVLLTRARQGMVIYLPKGNKTDHTRPPEFYDPIFDFLTKCGIKKV